MTQSLVTIPVTQIPEMVEMGAAIIVEHVTNLDVLYRCMEIDANCYIYMSFEAQCDEHMQYLYAKNFLEVPSAVCRYPKHMQLGEAAQHACVNATNARRSYDRGLVIYNIKKMLDCDVTLFESTALLVIEFDHTLLSILPEYVKTEKVMTLYEEKYNEHVYNQLKD